MAEMDNIEFAFHEGVNADWENEPIQANPYPEYTASWDAWFEGWHLSYPKCIDIPECGERNEWLKK